jgi:HlyD family secretion protein
LLLSSEACVVASEDHKFEARIIGIRRILGKKSVRADELSECVGTKILETLAELDVGDKLPLGLRVESKVVPNL